MKVKIRTESFDPDFYTQDELIAMEDELYSDIPKNIRSLYSQYEKKWLSKKPFVESSSSSFPTHETIIPVGINSKMAFGMNVDPNYIFKMIESEQIQFHKAWKSSLLRSKSREQYEYRLKKFIVGDPNLKVALEKIYKDEELLTFRNSLPTEKDLGYEHRQDSEVQTISVEEPEKSESIYDTVYFLYYTCFTKGWKTSKICVKSEQTPSIFISEKFILISFYVNQTTVCSKVFDMDFKFKTEWYCTKQGPLRCAINDHGWMIVSDGITVHQKRDDIIYQHTIEGQIITSIHISEYDDFVFLGTYNGQIYDINPFTIRSYSKTLDCTPILSIDTSGSRIIGQTITSIITSDSKLFNATRPLTSMVKGTFVIFLTKYGTVKICSRIHDNTVLEFKCPKGKSTNIDKVIPWYDRGIFFDGKTLAVLYPEGTVLRRELK